RLSALNRWSFSHCQVQQKRAAEAALLMFQTDLSELRAARRSRRSTRFGRDLIAEADVVHLVGTLLVNDQDDALNRRTNRDNRERLTGILEIQAIGGPVWILAGDGFGRVVAAAEKREAGRSAWQCVGHIEPRTTRAGAVVAHVIAEHIARLGDDALEAIENGACRSISRGGGCFLGIETEVAVAVCVGEANAVGPVGVRAAGMIRIEGKCA